MIRRALSPMKKYLPTGVYRRLVDRHTLGLFYHVVSNDRLPHIIHLFPYKTPEALEQDLIYLREHFHPMGYEELEETRLKGKRLPKNSMVVSFDDGMAECFSEVRPLLQSYKVPCIFFLTTSLLDGSRMLPRHKVSLCLEKVKESLDEEMVDLYRRINERYGQQIDSARAFEYWIGRFKAGDEEPIDEVCAILGVDWMEYLQKRRVYLDLKEIQQLYNDGFTIGAHSMTHPKMGSVASEVMEQEIAGSVRAICEITGEQKVPFAFPFTATGVDRMFLDGLVERHPEVGLLFDSKGIHRDRPYIFNRIWADPPGENEEGSNLGKLITEAYREAKGN